MLRVGILLDSFRVPAWVHVMLRRIADSDYAEIALVVLDDSPPPPPQGGFVRRLIANRSSLIPKLHDRYDNGKFHPERDAFEIVDAEELLSGIPVVKVQPKRKKSSDRFSDADVDEIRRHELDVLSRLGFRTPRGKILQAAKHGVWSYHHGDNSVNRGGPAGYWEVMEGHDLSGSMLQVLSEDLDSGIVLDRSLSGTVKASVRQNRSAFHWKTLSMLPRKLKRLNDLGPEKFFEEVRRLNPGYPFYSQRLYTAPTNLEGLRLLRRYWGWRISLKLDRMFFDEQWCILFHLRDTLSSSLWRYKAILPPSDRFWADPCVVQRDGSYFIFFEEYIYRDAKGNIAVIRMDEEGNYSEPEIVLDRPYHLSYPFIFEWDGDLYMMPESGKNRTVEVYRCTEFPTKWTLHKTLMEGVEAYDATLFQHDGRWWMFANILENPGASPMDELFLFHADSPLSDHWTPHPMNPIVSDVTRARPAGGLYRHDGEIYRPSQNCGPRYGYGIQINRVAVLNEREYREETVNSITPDWKPGLRSIHTLNHQGRLTVADCERRRFKYRWGPDRI